MPARVFIEKNPNQAEYKVFFADYDHQQQNHQIIAGGKLVQNAGQADVKVCIVNYRHQADICILRKNFPK